MEKIKSRKSGGFYPYEVQWKRELIATVPQAIVVLGLYFLFPQESYWFTVLIYLLIAAGIHSMYVLGRAYQEEVFVSSVLLWHNIWSGLGVLSFVYAWIQVASRAWLIIITLSLWIFVGLASKGDRILAKEAAKEE